MRRKGDLPRRLGGLFCNVSVLVFIEACLHHCNGCIAAGYEAYFQPLLYRDWQYTVRQVNVACPLGQLSQAVSCQQAHCSSRQANPAIARPCRPLTQRWRIERKRHPKAGHLAEASGGDMEEFPACIGYCLMQPSRRFLGLPQPNTTRLEEQKRARCCPARNDVGVSDGHQLASSGLIDPVLVPDLFPTLALRLQAPGLPGFPFTPVQLPRDVLDGKRITFSLQLPYRLIQQSRLLRGDIGLLPSPV
nr:MULTISPECIES: hypothetical protein [unclassified Pseudomonas]